MQAPRYLCSQLVRLLVDGRAQWANLEEIWSGGAMLECEEPVATGAAARLFSESAALDGHVVKVNSDEFGWHVEMAFAEATPWSPELWRPEHLLDPGTLT